MHTFAQQDRGPRAHVQPKSRVNTPGDRYEREADRVADQVMRMPWSRSRPGCACGGGCPSCRSGTDRAAPPVVDEVLRSPGQPLDARVRGFMESRLGHDFGGVRVHTDARAVESAEAVDARAYTVGEDIAFGKGEYRPHTGEGKRLLAHELAHVVQQAGGPGSVPGLQRQEEEEAGKPGTAKTGTGNTETVAGTMKFRGCDEGPYSIDYIRQSAENALDTARTCEGIRTESLREDIVAAFDGLTIVCYSDDVKSACGEAKKGRQRINLYKKSLDGSYCPSELAATIFHEAVHLAEGFNLTHGNLSWDCGAACYPTADELKRGNASNCKYETGFRPFAGASAGLTLRGTRPAGTYVRGYIGLQKRRPLLGIVKPAFGIGLSLVGEPTTGEAGDPLNPQTLFSVLGELRFDPDPEGGFYVALRGGADIPLKSERSRTHYPIGVSAGYRWSIYDVSLDAGTEYDPTQRAGEERLYTLGLTFQVAPKVRRH